MTFRDPILKHSVFDKVPDSRSRAITRYYVCMYVCMYVWNVYVESYVDDVDSRCCSVARPHSIEDLGHETAQLELDPPTDRQPVRRY